MFDFSKFITCTVYSYTIDYNVKEKKNVRETKNVKEKKNIV
jgi:hypothetical protein